MGRLEWPPLLPSFFPRRSRVFSFPFPLRTPFLCSTNGVPQRGKSPIYASILSAFLGVLLGRAYHDFPRSFFAKSTVVPAPLSLSLSLSLFSLLRSCSRNEHGWPANSFKSRCGPGNSANPLRIHRAPLANSSLLS